MIEFVLKWITILQLKLVVYRIVKPHESYRGLCGFTKLSTYFGRVNSVSSTSVSLKLGRFRREQFEHFRRDYVFPVKGGQGAYYSANSFWDTTHPTWGHYAQRRLDYTNEFANWLKENW